MNNAVFHGEKDITYLFLPAKKETPYLVVMFSAFSPKGAPPRYNYIRTLDGLDVNKLFILDNHGERGCYYLGENRDFAVERSVLALIRTIASNYNIPFSNITSCGSSKGGYAALYFAIKHGFGHAVVGAPQTKLGTYLRGGAKEMLHYIDHANDIEWLDSLLYRVVEECTEFPDIHISVGKGDSHYQDHVIPFVSFCETLTKSISLDVSPALSHDDARFFQLFLVDTLISLIPPLQENIYFTKQSVTYANGMAMVEISTNKKCEYSLIVQEGREKIFSSPWKNSGNFTVPLEKPGFYTFKVYAKHFLKKISVNIMLDIDPLPDKPFVFVKEEGSYNCGEFVLNYEANKPCSYAAYVYCNKERVGQLPWQDSGTMKWVPEKNGTYYFSVFARRPVGEKIRVSSKSFEVSHLTSK